MVQCWEIISIILNLGYDENSFKKTMNIEMDNEKNYLLSWLFINLGYVNLIFVKKNFLNQITNYDIVQLYWYTNETNRMV